MVLRVRLRGRDSQGVWDGHVHTAIFEMDNQQGSIVLYMNSAQYFVATWTGGEFGGEWIHVYLLAESSETVTTLFVNWLYHNTKEKV